MIGFFVKKAFFDGWDNLLLLAAFNIVHALIIAIAFLLPPALGAPAWVSGLAFCAALVAMSVWQAVCAFAMDEVAEYSSPRFRASLGKIRAAWKPGLQLGLVLLGLLGAAGIAIPFYFSMGNFVGLLLASLLFWLCLFVLLAVQFFLALTIRRKQGFLGTAKACAIMVLDNPGFSIFLLLHGIITMGISLLVAFLVPGPAGLSLAQADAVRLRLKKYEWLEARPDSTGARRSRIPWDELLEEDRELVGKRTLKGMIFPWKDMK